MLLARVVRCSAAGKGFGSSSDKEQRSSSKGGKRKQTAGIKSGDSKAVQRAVKLVEQQERRQGPAGGARPVDPREAARGKVEYVKVKDWGSGKTEDLGSLKLEDQEAKQVFAAAAAPGAGEDGSSGGSSGGSEPAMPFHEVLARRLELLQTQGGMNVAQPQGSKPLPPFDRWAFSQQHYTEYLADLYAVHAGLEASLAAAEACLKQEAGQQQQDQQRQQQQLLVQALQLVSPELGLSRAEQLQLDLQRLQQRQQQQQAQQQQAQGEGQGQGQEGSSSSSSGGGGSSSSAEAGVPPGVPAPTQHAAAYASYLASLGRLVRAAEGPEEQEQAVLRLLSNAYILLLSHLTSGGRVAAAASRKLDLQGCQALNCYSSYPALREGERPLEVFVAAVNSLGRLLGEEQQEAMMQELGKAMTKTSMLLTPLAREA